MSLRVGHGNGRNKPSLVDFIRETDWDSFSPVEAERLTGELYRLPGSRLHVIDAAWDRAKDNPILVKSERHNLGSSTRSVSRALGRRGTALNRVAPARVLTEARYAHPLATRMGLKGVAHLSVHPVAGPAQLNGRNPMAPLVREYRKAWRQTVKAWKQAKRDGFLVVLTSDAQMGAESTRSWAPARQARRMGARTWVRGIDWIFYDSRLRLDGIPEVRQLFDHPGFIASLKEDR